MGNILSIMTIQIKDIIKKYHTNIELTKMTPELQNVDIFQDNVNVNN